MPCWLRLYTGSGTRMEDGVMWVDTVEAGVTLPIWMREERRTVREEPDVEARLGREGRIWMRCYSRVVPDGECGFVAVDPRDFTLCAITERAFAEAQARGWELPAGGIDAVERHPAERFRHLLLGQEQP